MVNNKKYLKSRLESLLTSDVINHMKKIAKLYWKFKTSSCHERYVVYTNTYCEFMLREGN